MEIAAVPFKRSLIRNIYWQTNWKLLMYKFSRIYYREMILIIGNINCFIKYDYSHLKYIFLSTIEIEKQISLYL